MSQRDKILCRVFICTQPTKTNLTGHLHTYHYTRNVSFDEHFLYSTLKLDTALPRVKCCAFLCYRNHVRIISRCG